MRTYQKGFEQNSLVTIVTFIMLYVLAYFSSEEGESKLMFEWPSILIFSTIIFSRFLMYLFAEEKKTHIVISHILVYSTALFWSASYGLELIYSEYFTDQHMLLIIFIMGIGAAGALSLSKDNKLTIGFLFSLLVPAAIFSYLYLHRLNIFIGVAFTMYLAYLVIYAKKYYLIAQESILAKKEIQAQKTELEKNHFALQFQNKRLERTLDKAKSADKAKSLFLANMSHEIRTPLNGIIGMAHIIHQEEKEEKLREKISIIQFSAETLVDLVNDILDFSKIEAGKLEIDLVHFNLYELIKNISSLFDLKAKEKNLKFEYHIDKNVPEYILSDQIRIKQIIINLINNAIKFTNKGGVHLLVKASLQEKAMYKLKFTISDTGIGISEKNQEEIFSSFTQSDASFTRKFGGTGLGLAISKKLARLLKGEIGVESELGKGSDFWFTIVAKVGEKNDNIDLRADVPLIRDLSILLAEDNKVNVIVAKQIIINAGHKVLVANNGLEAIELFKKEKFDLILMDIMMPEMDGLTASGLIRMLEKDNNIKPTPIIALTANVVKEDQEKYLAAGMNDFISKPIHPKVLLEKIQHIFLPPIE